MKQPERTLVKEYARKGLTLATAESCTGGLIAKRITDVPGSSAVLCGGLVTYTNEAKTALLGVDPAIFARDTEVSHACAEAMAEGARRRLGTDVGVSTTGFAGPGGGTDRDPVGTVYIGVSTAQGTRSERFCAPAGATRSGVRTAATNRALELLLEI
ncbi:MAG: nicotinamide-nucleotide amidohydrolase family protein [Clostridia bacterium]|nr:nicotinamide-nucleotide amidohydrolase family protein [Clostridia bacterium]